MRVVVADKFPESGLQALRALGLTVHFDPGLSADDLPQAVERERAGIVVVRSTKVTADTFARGKDLSLVIRAGAGVNTIDLAAASRSGVFVANCPGKNAIAVAELTMGLLLALDRNIAPAARDLAAGTWNKKKYGQGRGLFGRTLGLVGFGAIAREVARRARGFGMQVLAHSRTLTDDEAEAAGAQRAETLEDLLAASDVVSVHVPYSEATHHLIGKAALATMQPGAYLIHTARGGVVDDEALAAAVASGHIRAAADVFEGEPGAGQAPFSSPLLEAEGFCGTPHIAASTEQAADAIADEVVRIVRDYLGRGIVHNTVNVVTDRPAHWTVVVRHLDRVGVLAGVLDALRQEDLNVQEMQNVVFHGNEAASATITLERAPSEELVAKLSGQPDILAVDVRGID